MATLDNTKLPAFLDRKLTSPKAVHVPKFSRQDLDNLGIIVSDYDGHHVVRIPYAAFQTIAPASAHSFEAEAHLRAVLDAAGIDGKRFQTKMDADFSVTFSQRPKAKATAPEPAGEHPLFNQTYHGDEDHAEFPSGAVRSKGVAGTKLEARFDLISPIALRRLAETCGEGAVKYGDHNWRKGIPVSNLMNHALAHFTAYLMGDKTEDHLAHAAWNLCAIMHFEEVKQPELFDLKTDDYAR